MSEELVSGFSETMEAGASGFEAVEDPAPLEYWRKFSNLRGEMVRRLLERGVSWRELGPLVRDLRVLRASCGRICFETWPIRFRIARRTPP